jgi:uncharacterized zinc-type alcohol dehydrogenase-like protein
MRALRCEFELIAAVKELDLARPDHVCNAKRFRGLLRHGDATALEVMFRVLAREQCAPVLLKVHDRLTTSAIHASRLIRSTAHDEPDLNTWREMEMPMTMPSVMTANTTVKAYAATSKGASLQPFEYHHGPLGDQQVEIAVSHCGVCHSDLSMIEDEWGLSVFPLVPGHEVVGTIAAVGSQVKSLTVGQPVGLGWQSGSCLHCHECLGGDHNLCASRQGTILHRYGGFADRVRCDWAFAVPLPEALGLGSSGPLFCAGVTVFNPLLQFGVKPQDRVGVIGVGGLGHLALQFLNKWGCEVYAFTSSDSKREEALRLGAHHVVSSRDSAALRNLANSLDFVISTVDVALDWATIIDILRPKGRLALVGVAREPIPARALPLIMQQRHICGSTNGSPGTVATMLEFCARHAIAPITETFALSKVNDALEHLRAGRARYRIVLSNDL